MNVIIRFSYHAKCRLEGRLVSPQGVFDAIQRAQRALLTKFREGHPEVKVIVADLPYATELCGSKGDQVVACVKSDGTISTVMLQYRWQAAWREKNNLAVYVDGRNR